MAHASTRLSRKFIEITANQLGWRKNDNESIKWEGKGLEEVGRRSDNGQIVIRIDPRYFRPSEVNTLLGDPTKAKEKLGWTPTCSVEELVKEMVDYDKKLAKQELLIQKQNI